MRSSHYSESDTSARQAAREQMLRALMAVGTSDQSTEDTQQHSPHPMVVVHCDLKRGVDVLEALRLQSQTQKHAVWAKALPQLVKHVVRGLVGTLIAVSALSSAEIRATVVGLASREGAKPTPAIPAPVPAPAVALAPDTGQP